MVAKTIEEIGSLDGYAHCKTCLEETYDKPYTQMLEVGVKIDTDDNKQYVYVNCKKHRLNITRWEIVPVNVSCDCCNKESNERKN